MSERHLRAVPFELRADAGDGLTLEGYATTFGEYYDVTDWLGTYRERIMPSAFTKTLRERKPVLQFDHGRHALIGSLPLGTFEELRADEHGLYVRARLSDNWLIAPVRDAIRDGAITGMSIQFAVPKGKDTWNAERTERTINEVALFELGPVVFPANASTSVGVRAADIAQALADPTLRAEVAHLLLGTRQAAADGTAAVEPPHTDVPAAGHPSEHAAGRSLAAAKTHVIKLRREP